MWEYKKYKRLLSTDLLWVIGKIKQEQYNAVGPTKKSV